MQEVRFTICPQDCWVCQVSERFPEVTGEVLSFNQVAGLGRWNSQNRKDLTRAFAYAKRRSIDLRNTGEKPFHTVPRITFAYLRKQ